MTTDELVKGTLWYNQPRRLFRMAQLFLAAFAAISAFTEITRPTEPSWHFVVVYVGLPVFLITPLFCALWPVRPWGQRESPDLVLRFSAGWRIGMPAWFFLPLAAITVAALLAQPPQTGPAVILAIFLVAGTAYFYLVARETFRVTEDGVQRFSPWTRKTTTIRWDEVDRVELDGLRRVTLRSSGRTIKVPLSLGGSCEFAARALTALPSPHLDQATNLRAVLNHYVSILSKWGTEPRDATPPWRMPGVLLASAAGLMALAVPVWTSSEQFEPPVHFTIPTGWVDLSPGVPEAQFDGLPPALRQQAQTKDVVAFAIERPSGPGAVPEQVYMAQVQKGKLDPDAAPAKLADLFLANLRATLPDARIVRQGVETIDGARVAAVEMGASAGSLFIYAVPLRVRFGLLLFSCGAAECDRVRQVAAATVRATGGISESTQGPQRRAGAVVLLFAGLMVALAGVQAALPRRQPAPAGTFGIEMPGGGLAPAQFTDPPPATLRRQALMAWAAILGQGGLFVVISLLPWLRPVLEGREHPVDYVAAAVGLVTFLASIAAPRFVRGQPGALPGSVMMLRHLVSVMLCSATMFAGIIGYILTRQTLVHGLTALGVAGFLIAFPSNSRLDRLIPKV